MTAMPYTSSKSRNSNTHFFIFSCKLVTQSVFKRQVTSHWVKVLKLSVKIIANSSYFPLSVPIFWQTPTQSSGLWLTQLGTLLERIYWGIYFLWQRPVIGSVFQVYIFDPGAAVSQTFCKYFRIFDSSKIIQIIEASISISPQLLCLRSDSLR